jgi:glycosyltransferase involved in cell wall biosynthesis
MPAAEMLVVDDASPDGTATRVETEAKHEPR